MRSEVLDPFDLLGVTRASTDAEITAAWRERMKAAHPDTGGSHEYAAALNWARDTLLDPQARFDFAQRAREREAPRARPRPESPPTPPPPPPPKPAPPKPAPPPHSPPRAAAKPAPPPRKKRRVAPAVVLLVLLVGAGAAVHSWMQPQSPPSTTATFAADGPVRVAPHAKGSAVPGEAAPADTCAVASGKGERRGPDPYCSPGALVTQASRDSVCRRDLSNAHPDRMAMWAARRAVARAYGSSDQRLAANARNVPLVIPVELGGAWHLDNMWRGPTTVTPRIVERTLDLLCQERAVTYAEVIWAAQVNALDLLVRHYARQGTA